MAACGMIRTLKYWSLTAAGERFIASSFTAIEGRFSSHRLSYRNASVRTTGFNKADAANF
jgi:hypothetical protein